MPPGLAIAAALALPSAEAAPLSTDIAVLDETGLCPEARQGHDALEHIVQRPVVPVAPSDTVFANIAFRRANGGFEALLHLTGAKQGERRLTDTGDSCGPLVQAVAVTLALLIDSGPHPLLTAMEGKRALPTPTLSLGSGPAFGMLPSATAAFHASLGVLWPRWSAHLGGFYLWPRDAQLAPGKVHVSLAAADGLLCRAFPGPALRFDACAAGVAGWLSGKGEGYPVSSQAGFFWSSVGAALRLGGPLGQRWLWAIATEGLLPLGQRSFSIGNLGVAYRSARMGGMAELQLATRL